MKRPRPLTVSLICLSALALGLSLYWLVDLTGPPADRDPAAKAAIPTYLTADEEVPLGPTLPKLAPALPEPSGSKSPPGVKPPEHIVPEESAPSDGEGSETYEQIGHEPEEKERRLLPVRTFSGAYDWRSGAVGRTDATATREVEIDPAFGWIGTTRRWVDGLIAQRGAAAYPALVYEAPRHRRKFQNYFIDRFEVSNHQYLTFLEATAAVTYNTSEHEARSLVEIAEALILDPPTNLDFEDGVAWQLFQANKLLLLDLFKSAIVESANGIVNEEKTFLRMRDRIVPRGTRLRFYDKAPPGHWPSMIYADNRGGFPVRAIAFEEALDYAIWDGRHVPSEFEWEFAARGPKGLDYPWGANAQGFDRLVNGGQVLDGDEFPLTVPVASLPQGISWIGCFNMIGNVSEWTSSFLAPYPEAGELPAPGGRPALVIRGGSVADADRLYLRSAYRGWPREAEEGPPRPRQRRPWTGFRTARYEEPGFSRTSAMHYFARRGGRLDPALLDPDIFSAWEGLQFEHFKRQFEDDLTRPGVKAIVVQPLQQSAVRPLGASWHQANTSEALIARDTLIELSFAQPVLVGMLHTDLHLTSTWHLLRKESDTLRRARCPPGSWYVGLFQGRLALIRPDFGDVFFAANRAAPKAAFNVRTQRQTPREGPGLPQVGLRYTPGTRDVQLTFETEIFHNETQRWVLNVDLRVDVDPVEARAVRDWEQGSRANRRNWTR